VIWFGYSAHILLVKKPIFSLLMGITIPAKEVGGCRGMLGRECNCEYERGCVVSLQKQKTFQNGLAKMTCHCTLPFFELICPFLGLIHKEMISGLMGERQSPNFFLNF
jgi:hypothetical protein